VLSRLERWILVSVVLAGVLVLATGVWAVVNRDRVTVWLTGDEVAAAQRVAMTAALPSGLEDDPTRSACATWSALRCAWSDASPAEAVQLMADVLAAAGVDVGAVACDDRPDLPEGLALRGAACVAEVPVAGETMWVIAMDRTPEGGVPLGRTAAWATWDELAMSTPMVERLQREWGWADPMAWSPLSATDVAAVVPSRLAPVLEEPCRTEGPDGCYDWIGPVDLADLGDDPVPALVAELVSAGYFVDAADADPSGIAVRAHRFVDTDTGRGLWLTVTVDGDVPTAQVFTL